MSTCCHNNCNVAPGETDVGVEAQLPSAFLQPGFLQDPPLRCPSTDFPPFSSCCLSEPPRSQLSRNQDTDSGPGPTLTVCVPWGKSVLLSEPQFSHLSSGGWGLCSTRSFQTADRTCLRAVSSTEGVRTGIYLCYSASVVTCSQVYTPSFVGTTMYFSDAIRYPAQSCCWAQRGPCFLSDSHTLFCSLPRCLPARACGSVRTRVGRA